MTVHNSVHCVHLEILVGANRRGLLNWSPVCEGRLSIIEPLIAEMFHVIGIDMANSIGYLRSCHSSIEVKHLRSDLLHDIRGRLNRHQLIPEDIPGTNYLDFLHKFSIVGEDMNTAEVHVTGEYFISKEPISKNSTVTVRTKQALSSGDINQVSKHDMHTIILLQVIIEVLSVPLDVVIANHSLQK